MVPPTFTMLMGIYLFWVEIYIYLSYEIMAEYFTVIQSWSAEISIAYVAISVTEDFIS